MNQQLWTQIQAFDLDSPPGEYGFSTRLAHENYWTKSFTALAILEYKKFMYLAATSDLMVSPSEIIDTVWHQHLIFTQSYTDFCTLIGKQIQHIPSTRNREEFQKFRQAKERTIQFYERDFGKQPEGIWNYGSMYESLNLDKAKLKIRTSLIIGILLFICLATPAYFLLRPVYINIDNPYFFIGFVAVTFFVFTVLEQYNKFKLKQITSVFNRNAFIYNLHPFELIYLQTQKLSNVINGTLNELIDNNTIRINTDNTIQPSGSNATLSIEQLQVMNVLAETGMAFYANLLRKLSAKPIFWNTANCMDAFKKYFIKSKKFGQLFYLNFSVLSVLLLCSFTRIVTGILREKPVTQIVIVTVVLTIIIILFLQRLTQQICTTTIPGLYKVSAQQIESDWQWQYFLLGTAALATSFAPLVKSSHRNNADNGGGNSCGSNCGSSCGSSCSSCGGCGGD